MTDRVATREKFFLTTRPIQLVFMMENNSDIIANWLLEEECEDILDQDNNSDTDAVSEQSDHDTDTEQSDANEEDFVVADSPSTTQDKQRGPGDLQHNVGRPLHLPSYTGKDGTLWQAHMPPRTRTPSQNIFKGFPLYLEHFKTGQRLLTVGKLLSLIM